MQDDLEEYSTENNLLIEARCPVEIKSSENVKIDTLKDVEVQAAGNVEVVAPTIDLKGNVNIKGAVNITGMLNVNTIPTIGICKCP